MIFKLDNQVMPYAWGTRDFIPHLLGKKPTGKPQAELWMGTHPRAESMVEHQAGMIPLSKFLREHNYGELGFLFKVLTAAEALSIQVHPNSQQAQEGFDRETKQGIHPESPRRNYKDPNPKPEILCALTDFWALSGFRPIKEIVNNMMHLCPDSTYGLVQELEQSRDIKAFYEELMTTSSAPRIIDEAAARSSRQDGAVSIWSRKLHNLFPEDISQIAPAFLNLIKLEPGEAVFLDAGILHTYLEGTGLELMSNSDNVLRGGLTEKHIDLQELLSIVDFRPRRPKVLQPGAYHTPADFRLSVMPSQLHEYRHPHEIIICIHGEAVIKSEAEYHIKKGESYFIPRNMEYFYAGDALVYRASAGY